MSARSSPAIGRRAGAIFVAPATAFFALFLLLPVVAVIGLAFTEWSGFNIDQIAWRGLSNFRTLGSDDIFRTALVHTVLFVVFSTIFLNVVGLALALLINSRVRGHDFLRVAMFLPLGLSPAIAALIWQQILGPYGFVNLALGRDGLGLTHKPIGFLGDPNLAFATVVAIAIWQYSGYNMLLYYAGLQSLPAERLEAAAIDGAGAWSRFRYVIVPYLRPVIAVVVVLNLIGGWKVFELIYVLTGGGPNRATEVLSTYLFQQAFEFSKVGYASTFAVVIVALATVSALARRRISGEVA
jgi:raffinose/stachyose/melibiose transport system permease protein